MPIQTLKVGSLGTHNTLGLAKAKGATFMLASTSEVYGDPEVHPQPETYWGHVNPIGPRGVYDEAKRFAEAMTMAYHRYHGLDVRIVRIFNTYGPRMRPGDGRVVSNFLVQALEGKPITIYGDGTQTRSFCYVDDEVRGFLALLDSRRDGPVNIGNDGEFTMLELAELVLEVTGSSSEIVHEALPVDDPKQRRPDLTLATERLGWEPEIPLREGLVRTAEYFRAAPRASSRRPVSCGGPRPRRGGRGTSRGCAGGPRRRGCVASKPNRSRPVTVDAPAGLAVGLGRVPADLALEADELARCRRPARGSTAREFDPRFTGSPSS